MLNPEDLLLIEAATRVIKSRYLLGYHSIGAAIRMENGAVFSGINLNAYAGHLAVCAESVALGAALTIANGKIDTVVAVRHPPLEEKDRGIRIVSPCGACRERIFDYGSRARVIIFEDGRLDVRFINELIPNKYSRPL